jgi:hypothetical protein
MADALISDETDDGLDDLLVSAISRELQRRSVALRDITDMVITFRVIAKRRGVALPDITDP